MEADAVRWLKTCLVRILFGLLHYASNHFNRSSNSYDDPHGILIDLSAQPGGANGNNPGYRVIVRKSKAINLQILENWLAKKGSFDERVLEALNFLDHLLREWPSTRYTPVKRAFFDQDEEGRNFDSILDVRKGFYQAIRPALVNTLCLAPT